MWLTVCNWCTNQPVLYTSEIYSISAVSILLNHYFHSSYSNMGEQTRADSEICKLSTSKPGTLFHQHKKTVPGFSSVSGELWWFNMQWEFQILKNCLLVWRCMFKMKMGLIIGDPVLSHMMAVIGKWYHFVFCCCFTDKTGGKALRLAIVCQEIL